MSNNSRQPSNNDRIDLDEQNHPSPRFGNWYTGPDGGTTAVTIAEPTDNQFVCLTVSGYGSGGTIPKQTLTWDDFVRLTDPEQRIVVHSPDWGVELPYDYHNALIETLEAYRKPYDDTAALDVYENYAHILPDCEPLTSTSEPSGNCSIDADTQPLEPESVYFTRPGTITAFAEPNENDYLPNVRISPPTIATYELAQHHVVPFDNDPNQHRAADATETFWAQHHPQTSCGTLNAVDTFLSLLN